jgi:amino acid transporter
VAIKLLILTFFVVVGMGGIDPARLSLRTWSSPLNLVAGGMIIFLAYEGFELIANTAGDARDPERTLPRAFYASVIAVIALYLLIATVTVGNLALDKIAAAQDYGLHADRHRRTAFHGVGAQRHSLRHGPAELRHRQRRRAAGGLGEAHLA